MWARVDIFEDDFTCSQKKGTFSLAFEELRIIDASYIGTGRRRGPKAT